MKWISYTPFYRDRKNHGIEYAARHASKLGFDGVEYLTRVPLGMLPIANQERAVLDSYGLNVACYSVFLQLFGADESVLMEQVKREIEAAAILGSKLFHHTLFPPCSMSGVCNTYDEVFSSIVGLADRIANECTRQGLRCLYEPQGVYFNGVRGLSKILGELRRRGAQIGVCGDLGNSLFVDEDPSEVVEAFADDILHVHVKDYRVTDRIETDKKAYTSLSGKQIYEAIPGEGSVDLRRCFRTLRGAGYDGAVSLEFDGNDDLILESLRFLKAIETE